MVEPEEFRKLAEEWANKFSTERKLSVVRMTTTGFFYERQGFIAPQFMAWGRAKAQMGA